MDKAKVEQWLNELAEAVTRFTSIEDLDRGIQLCSQCRRCCKNIPYVQLYSGIDKIAKILGIELSVAEDEDGITLSFMWNDVMFLQYHQTW